MHLRCCYAQQITVRQLICGLWGVSWQSFTLCGLFFLAVVKLMRFSRYAKFLAHHQRLVFTHLYIRYCWQLDTVGSTIIVPLLGKQKANLNKINILVAYRIICYAQNLLSMTHNGHMHPARAGIFKRQAISCIDYTLACLLNNFLYLQWPHCKKNYNRC